MLNIPRISEFVKYNLFLKYDFPDLNVTTMLKM
jgi:hypothetical protein